MCSLFVCRFCLSDCCVVFSCIVLFIVMLSNNIFYENINPNTNELFKNRPSRNVLCFVCFFLAFAFYVVKIKLVIIINL
jgi:hypothetical protein